MRLKAFFLKISRSPFFYPTLLVLASFIVHLHWFSGVGVLTYDDWRTHTLESSLQDFSLPSAWTTNGLGGVNINASFFATTFISGLLAALGIGFNISERLIYMLPITVIAPIAAYFFVKQFAVSRLSAAIGSLVYVFNSYFLLIQTRHLTIATAYAFFPLALALFIRAIDKKSNNYLVGYSFIAFVLGSYDFRIFYILLIVTLIYLLLTMIKMLIMRESLQLLFKTLVIGVLSILIPLSMNAFWLLGLSQTSSIANNGLFSRGLFGNDILNTSYALALFLPFWNGTKPVWFELQNIPWYFYIVPILSILAILITEKKLKVLYLSLILAIGLTLVKQSSAPFEGLYLWLYGNVPGFNAFREASKFFVLLGLAFAALTAICIDSLQTKSSLVKNHVLKSAWILAPIAVVALTTVLIKPYVTGEIQTLFVQRTADADYAQMHNFLRSDNDDYRVMWVPQESRWSYASSNVKNVDASYALTSTNTVLDAGDVFYNRFADIMRRPDTLNVLGSSNIKYFVIPIRDTVNDDDFFKFYSDNRDQYIELMNSLRDIKRVDIGTSKILVYKNLKYSPYISVSSDAPVILDGRRSYGIDFMNFLGLSDITRIDESNTGLPTSGYTKVVDISNSIKDTEPTKDGRSKRYDLSQPSSDKLYIDSTKKKIAYENNGILTTFKSLTEGKLTVNGLTEEIGANVDLLKIQRNKSYSYIFSYGDKLYPLDTASSVLRTFGIASEEMNLYSKSKNNQVANPSFDTGLWNTKVIDCNNYDDRPLISQRLAEDSTGKNKFLQLTSLRHTACVQSSNIDVIGGGTYQLSYKYFLEGNQKAGYKLIFNDSAKTTLSNDQLSDPGKWNNLDHKIVVPNGATSVNIMLMGYPDDQRKYSGKTNYDDVVFEGIDFEGNIYKSASPLFSPVEIGNNKSVNLSLTAEDLDTANKISNPSFENGLWKSKVSDCNAYDDKPLIGMRLSDLENNGNQSLELNATRHVACTGMDNIKVKEGATYRFGFDYAGTPSKQAGYYIDFKNNGQSIGDRILISDKKWNKFTRTINIPYGTTNIDLLIYSYADDSNASKNVNYYDNFFLNEVPAIEGRLYSLTKNMTKTSVDPKVSFENTSPTNKKLTIYNFDSPININLAETYNPGWTLSPYANRNLFTGKLPISEIKGRAGVYHSQTSNMTNSWQIDPNIYCTKNASACSKNTDGTYTATIMLDFSAQRWFNLGLIISIFVFTLCFGWLGYISFKRLRNA